jgi:xanthine dehydrogenase accessory factor
VQQLLQEIIRRAGAGEAVAVCTLVRTRGSTPQQPGAVMLVLRDGQTLGTIGGGCVEAEVRSRALRLLLDSAPSTSPAEAAGRLLTFQLDHDLGWDDGLICGGNVEVALQVVRGAEQTSAFRDACEHLAAGRPAQITVVALDEAGQPRRFEREIEPAPSLIIAGAGHVGAALAAIARLTDFNVTVIDDRADMASPERFPSARCLTGSIEEALASCRIDERTHVVIVTRGHRNDGRALAAIINSPAQYIGLIGSRRKVLAIFDDLRRSGASREALKRVHAPIGLDIGAVTPGEIAVSIFAELIATRRAANPPAASMRVTAAQVDALFDGSRPHSSQ